MRNWASYFNTQGVINCGDKWSNDRRNSRYENVEFVFFFSLNKASYTHAKARDFIFETVRKFWQFVM